MTTDPRTFELDDGSVYQRIPAAEFPDGDAWDSLDVEERLGPGPRTAVAVTSQNGWSANDRSVIASFTIPGTKTKIALRAGDVSVVILDFLAWWNREIEQLDGSVLDDWGYAERTIRGSTTTLSNHASGTAGDANATKHPLGTHTLSKPDLAKVKDRLALYRGTLRHGAFYTGRVDEMHVEINAGPALVRAVADDIRAGRLGGGFASDEELTMAQYDNLVALLQQQHQDMATLVWAARGDVSSATQLARDNHQSVAGVMYALAGQILTAIAAQGPVEVNAEAIADAIPADIAEQVAQKLADRLAT